MKTAATTTIETLTATARACDLSTLIAQIGNMNILAISGGRVAPVMNAIGDRVGLSLPVSSGYAVVVILDANDTYTVSRVMRRGAKLFDKGSVSDVYAEDVGEVAYQASCYRNVVFGS